MAYKGVPFTLLVFLFHVVSMVSSTTAYCSYYGNPYYSPYSSWGHENGPIISLELDEKKSRNLDLRIAARENRYEDVRSLLKEGADANACSDQGETALMYAARSCAFESAELLLKWSANPNAQDVHGRTALMYSTMEACLPITQLLLRTPNISIDPRDDMHRSAMDYAEQGVALTLDGPPTRIFKLLKNAFRLKRVSRK